MEILEVKEITSLVTDSLIVEEVYNEEDSDFLFAIYDCKQVSYRQDILINGVLFLP